MQATDDSASDASGPAHRGRRSDGLTRGNLLALLRRSPVPRSVRELADALGLHPNSLRGPLDRLVAEGLVHRATAPPGGRGRPGFRFTARTERDPARPYRELARAVIDELALGTRASSRAVMAGERWGRATVEAGPRQGRAGSPGKRLVELLDASGFAPRIGDPAALKPTIGLHRCPFGSLAVDQPEVVCGVHLGLMRGALEALDEAADGVTLEPFVEPSLCVVHLTPRLLQKA